jgi:hypothetical protein
VELGEGVELLADPARTICNVAVPKIIEVETDEEDEEGLEGEEGEEPDEAAEGEEAPSSDGE